MAPKSAEILALEALGWLAGEEDGMGRFLAASGVDPADLRQAAGSRELGVAILDFMLAHEDLLLRFCENSSIAPGVVQTARYRLD